MNKFLGAFAAAAMAVSLVQITAGSAAANGSAVPKGDTAAGVTVRVTVSSAGLQGNGDSPPEPLTEQPSISGNGRFVAFSSVASNLVRGDTNTHQDVFVRDLLLRTTRRVSISTNGVQANNISVDPSISANGRYVAFTSLATNLVPGDTNGAADVFVRDLSNGTTRRVSLTYQWKQANGGSTEPSISGGGRYVAFTSGAPGLVWNDPNKGEGVFVRDLVTGNNWRVSVSSKGVAANGYSYLPSISPGGRYVAFTSDAPNLVPGDTNAEDDVFVRDLVAGTTRRASVDANGHQLSFPSYRPTISRGGQFVAYVTDYAMGVDLWSSATGKTRPVATGSYTDFASISEDGRYVALQASFLLDVPGDGVYVWDRYTDRLRLASLTPNRDFGDNDSETPAISADGRFVAFASYASNLVAGDTNRVQDVFVRGPLH